MGERVNKEATKVGIMLIVFSILQAFLVVNSSYFAIEFVSIFTDWDLNDRFEIYVAVSSLMVMFHFPLLLIGVAVLVKEMF